MRNPALKRTAVAALLDAVIIVLCALLFSSLYVRCDVTAGNRTSVAPVTGDLLSMLDDTLKISYYVSPELEVYTGGVFQIDAKLREFAAANRFVSYIKTDPAVSGSGKNAEAFGIIPRQINTVRDNRTLITTVYSGILFEYKGRMEVIPVVYEAPNLEYMAASCISRLIFPRMRTVALFAPGTAEERDQLFGYVPQWLESLGFDAVFVDSAADCSVYDCIVVFGDRAVTAEDVAMLCRYSEQGGAILAAVSPSTLSLYSDWVCSPIHDFRLAPLLRSFGIRVVPEIVQDTSNIMLQLAAADGGHVEQVPYPLWVQVLPSGLNESHPVTASVNALTCFWPGYLAFDAGTSAPDETRAVTPLVFSSVNSAAVAAPFDTNPYGVLPPPEENMRQPYCLAAAAERTANGVSGRLVVIADSLFVSGAVDVSGSIFNFDFFSNAVEWLSGNEELLQLKSAGAGVRRLEFDPDNPRDVRSAFYAAAFCCAGIPALCLAVAVVFWRKRRKSV